jgi:hypothetical protein
VRCRRQALRGNRPKVYLPVPQWSARPRGAHTHRPRVAVPLTVCSRPAAAERISASSISPWCCGSAEDARACLMLSSVILSAEIIAQRLRCSEPFFTTLLMSPPDDR